MIRYTSGYLCAPMSSARAALLDLPPMVPMSDNADPNRTAYCVTVDAVGGVVEELGLNDGGRGGQEGGKAGKDERVETTTGISANDRSVTCGVLASPGAKASHLRRPGHVVPLTARDGGVRVRRGHTEAGWEFARLAGIEPAVAVIGEMVVDGEAPEAEAVAVEVGKAGSGASRIPELRDSGMMRMKECLEFGRRWGIKCCTIEDLAAYVEKTEGPYQQAKR